MPELPTGDAHGGPSRDPGDSSYALEPRPNPPRLPGEVIQRPSADDALDSLAADLVLHASACVRNFGDFHLALSGGPAWTLDLVNGDHFLGSSTTPAAVSGYPSITVPAGEVAGLPIGVSFIGPAWSEPQLLTLAYAFEQTTKARKVPPLGATHP